MATKKRATASKAKRTPTQRKKVKRAAPARKPVQRKPVHRRAPPPGRAPPRAKRPAPVGAAITVPAAAPAPREAPDVSRPTAMAIAHAGLDKKAEHVTVLDVRGLASYADYFVVMTADSDRQAGAIADHVEQTMKAGGVTKVGVEGYEGGRWILVDYGDVVAHVMNRESRGFYDLEGLWADAPRISVEG
jgi:ribosome-associated protein